MRRWKFPVGVVTAISSCVLLGALVVASSGVATAQSRAANRWNHVPGAAGSTAQDGDDQAVKGAVRVIHLHEVFTDKFTFVDVGTHGDSPGDYGVFRDPIADPDTGDIIGTVDVQCIASYADQCRGSISLVGRGQIVFDGITPLGVDPDRFAITGGTGEFSGAGGKVTVRFPDFFHAQLTLHLV